MALPDLSEMGSHLRVSRPADIVFCGFCCKPFTTGGNRRGFDDNNYGDNYVKMVNALEARRQAGVVDKCLLVENVPNLLSSFLKPEDLALLTNTGWHVRIYVAAARYFSCANLRERLVLIGFRDRAHFDAFVPPPATSASPLPVSSVLQPLSVTTGHQYFIEPKLYVGGAGPRADVVGRDF